jgi:hypothetical protein
VAQPTEVGRDNRVVFDERVREVAPHVARCAEAVQHNNRRTMPADAYVDRDAVGFDLMRLHRSREGMDTILTPVIVHRLTPNLKGTRSRKLEEKLALQL